MAACQVQWGLDVCRTKGREKGGRDIRGTEDREEEESRGRLQEKDTGIGKCLVDGHAKKRLRYSVSKAASRNRLREDRRHP